MHAFRIHEYVIVRDPPNHFYQKLFDFWRCNLWVGEDENKKEAGLPVQNENDWLSSWSWKENVSLMLQQMRQKVARFAEPFKSLLTLASTTSSCEWILIVWGQIAESFVFFNLYLCPENVWWAGGGKLTSSWQFTFDFWSTQKQQIVVILPSIYPSILHHLSMSASWWRQAEQGGPDVLVLGHNPKVFWQY